LPAPGRSGDEDHAVRAADREEQRLLLVGLVAERLDAELDARRVEYPHDDLLAEERRQRRHAKIDRLAFRQHELHPPVLRHALFGNVESRDHLDPRRDLVLDRERWLRHLHQDAVETVADPVELFVRLEMDVRCAGGDRVDQHLLDVADDRRVLDLAAVLVAGRLDRAILERDLDVFERRHFLQRRARRLDDLDDGLRELVVLDDDGLDDEVRLEAHLVERLQVGGVGRCHVQTVAALVQRQNAPRLGYPGVEVFPVDLVEIEAGEVEQRNAERARGEHGKLVRRQPLAGKHLLDERYAGRLRLHLQRLGFLLGHDAVLGERAGETADVSGGGVGGHRQLCIFTLLRFCHGCRCKSHRPRDKAGRNVRESKRYADSASRARDDFRRVRSAEVPLVIPATIVSDPARQAALPRTTGRLFHSHKTCCQDDARSVCVCKGDVSRPTGGSRRTTRTARSCVCRISTAWPSTLKLMPASGISPRCSTMSPFSVFGPSRGNRVPSRRLSVRSGAIPSTTTLPSGSRRKPSGPPGACVVNSPMISSMMSSIVTSPCSSPYSSTTRPSRWRSVWNCCNCVSSGVPTGTKYGGRSTARMRSASTSPPCITCRMLLTASTPTMLSSDSSQTGSRV